ncbi:MAG TPA: hypothetical protein DEP84_36155 [Chloroflexi bacterium]|nr:hypothetical protein [Chloroflexota bacterium]
MKRPLTTAFVLIALLMLVTVAAGLAVAATGGPVLINEVLASHTGTDDTEYIELFGTPGTPLSGLSLLVVEGDAGAGPGTIDRRIDFKPFHTIGPNGFFLVGNCAGLPAHYGVTPDTAISDNFLENSSLTVALVETASLSGGLVSSGEIVHDAVALTDGGTSDVFFFDAPVIGPDGAFFPAGARRVTDGGDTDTAGDWTIADFFLGPSNTPTGGGLNGCAPLALTIPEIQGDGQRSPYEGEIVATSGVVTLFTANSANFWLQDPDGDGSSATSDGIFVAGGGFPAAGPRPAVGDLIRITAQVEEQQFGNALPLTRLRNVKSIEVISSDNPLPAPIELADLPNESIIDAIAFWEPLEGMLVAARNALVVAPTSGFGEFAMLAKDDAQPGSGYFPQTRQILVRSLGGEMVDYNPERILVDDSSLENPILVLPGDRVRSLTGAVDYTFGNYKLQPSSFDVERHNLPTLPASTRSGLRGDTVITTFNVENLFDLVDNPAKDDEGSTPTPEELEIKLSKLALAIQIELELPEIIVVQEVENTEILQELGDRVNAATGTNYEATSFETSDGRGIEVGFLWDANRVALHDAYQLSGPAVEAAFGLGSPSPGREPLVGVFEIDGRTLTIVGNHFKSKSGDDPLFGVNQPPIRVTEVQRKAQARVVRDFVNSILEANPDALVMVAGDLNDFQFGEPGEGADHPVAILEGSSGEVPLTNLLNLEKDAETFTFIFDGNSQVLDHMLASPALYNLFAAVDILHFNAGFPAALSDNASTPLHAADHDPLEGRFRFRESP